MSDLATMNDRLGKIGETVGEQGQWQRDHERHCDSRATATTDSINAVDEKVDTVDGKVDKLTTDIAVLKMLFKVVFGVVIAMSLEHLVGKYLVP